MSEFFIPPTKYTYTSDKTPNKPFVAHSRVNPEILSWHAHSRFTRYPITEQLTSAEMEALLEEEVAPRMVPAGDKALREIDPTYQTISGDKFEALGLALPEKYQQACQLAADMILEMAQLVGKPVSPDFLKFILLSPEVFTQLTPQADSLGFVSRSRDVAFIRYEENVAVYLLAQVIFHEYVHLVIDFTPTFFTAIKDVENEVLLNVVVAYFNSRTGLELTRLARGHHPDKVTPDRHYGLFLNELGNLIWQKAFFERLVSHETYRQANPQEAALFPLAGDEAVVPLETIEPPHYRFSIKQRYILGSRDSQEPGITSTAVWWQIADELSARFGLVEGKDLKTCLLEAKADPRCQHTLADRLDAEFGKGFYYTLKTRPIDFNSLIQLLIQVQKPAQPQLDHASATQVALETPELTPHT